MSRKYTNLLIEMVEDGKVDKDQLILAFAKYMSEDEVKDMMHVNEITIDNDEE